MRHLIIAALLGASTLAVAADPRMASMTYADIHHQHRAYPGGYNMDLAILRVDALRQIDDTTTAWLRIEPSIISTDIPNRTDNRTGQWHTDIGDTTLLAGLIKSPLPGLRLGAGAQLVAPTASRDNMGYGRWLLAPGALFEADLPGRTGYLQVTYRDFQDIGSRGQNRPRQHVTMIEPILHVDLPAGWFADYTPAYRRDQLANKDFVANGIGGGRWLARGVNLSASYSWATQAEYMVYRRQYETRLMVWF